MGFIDKLKLLFLVKKPAGEIIDEVAEVKKTKKWFHFAVTLIGTLASTAAALSGHLPPQIQILAASILQGLYNIVRGADKADNADVKGTFTTTEFWLSALVEIQKMLVVAHDGGVSAPWLASATSIVGATLAFGQNLAARAPNPQGPATPTIAPIPVIPPLAK